jgi:hypothetical protein
MVTTFANVMANPLVKTSLKIGGIVLALGGVGLIVYMIVWALKSKLAQALAPYLGWLKSVLLSISSHPIAWLAAIGGLAALAIGGYVAYAIVNYIRGQKTAQKEIERDAKATKAKGEEPHYTEEQKAAASTTDDVFVGKVVKQARVLVEIGTSSGIFSAAEIDDLREGISALETAYKEAAKATADCILHNNDEERASKARDENSKYFQTEYYLNDEVTKMATRLPAAK